MSDDELEVGEQDLRSRRCAARTQRGGRCKAWAKVGTMPPLCHRHFDISASGGLPAPTTEDQRVKKLEQLLMTGNHLQVALTAAGVPQRTYEYWRMKAREGVEAYVGIIERVDSSLAEGEARLVTLIGRAATEDWRAGAWLLKWQYGDRQQARRGEDENATGKQQEHQGEDADPFAALEQDELEQRRQAKGRAG